MTLDAQTRIGAAHLLVRDLDHQSEFYQQALGFELRAAEGNTRRLGTQTEDIVILEGSPAAPPSGRTTGLYHIAVLLPSRAELARSLWRLVDSHYRLEGAADHAVSEALYLADPEGNGIELYRDRDRRDWPIQDGKLAMYNAPIDLDALLVEAERESAGSPVHPLTRMGHIHLRASSIPANLSFYVDILGFDLMQRYGPSAAFVSAGGYHHHVGMNTWETAGAPPAPPGSLGMQRYEILLPGDSTLHAVRDRLQAAQLPVEPSAGGWLVSDPAGVQILLKTAPA